MTVPTLTLPADPWVVAVEDTTVQLTWRALPAGGALAEVAWPGGAAGRTWELPTDGSPGGAVLDGLPPGTTVALRVTDAAGRVHARTVRTLPSLPGPERFRFATMSDLHLATRTFGFWNTIHEPRHQPAATSVRAARAAVAEAVAWGAQLLVLKGDLTNKGAPDEWAAVADLVARCPVPVLAIPGNHDVAGWRGGAVDASEQLRALGIGGAAPVRTHDVPGLHIVLADTTRSGVDRPRLRHVEDLVVSALAASPVPAFVAMHHHLMALPVPTSWPPGVGSHHSAPFLTRVAAAQPATLLTSGHTHRNRRRHVGPLVLTEVGSPKDYPGGWAGYVVHDAGIRQVVRRTADPDVLTWTDRTADAALHLWGRWSPGHLDDRCFVHRWPTRP